MRRREFIGLIGGAAAWPHAARAQQQADKLRRIGVVIGLDEHDKEGQNRFKALQQGLEELGWKSDINATLEIRWTGGKSERATEVAKEIVAFQPEVIVGHGTPVVAA